MSFGKHLAGVSLLLAACASVGLLSLLPMRGSAGIQLPFLGDSEPPIVVAFAGFPGCADVCPLSLALIAEVYGSLDRQTRAHVAPLFINIQRQDPAELAQQYAQAFHPDFLSYTVGSDDAEQIYRSLSLTSFEHRHDAVSHTGFIYVFAREHSVWRIEHVFRRTPANAQLLSLLGQLADAVS